MTPKLNRIRSGFYTFYVDGTLYAAHRNEAGFAGRQWELFDAQGKVLADMFGSRSEVVAYAVWQGRDFWAHVAEVTK